MAKKLTITLTPEYDSVYFAYFAPYSYERHQDLLHNAQMHLDCNLQVLGQTLDGRDMTLLKIGEEGQGKRNIWITARQHPGETMAEWFVEGMLDRLLDEDDGAGTRSRYVISGMASHRRGLISARLLCASR
jgi:murein tripeptide amidase MpaA